MRSTAALLTAAALLAAAVCPVHHAAASDSAKAASGIQWFATWAQAAKEAKRTKRPILLIAAAPHCKNISGIW